MAKRSKQANSKTRESPSSVEVAQAIESQRRRLNEIRAVIDSQAKLIHETYDFEVGEADLGHCCEVARDILERVTATLGLIAVELLKPNRAYVPIALAHQIEVPRQELFRAMSVASAMENLLRLHHAEEHYRELRTIMMTLVRMMDEVIEAIEPLSLGLR